MQVAVNISHIKIKKNIPAPLQEFIPSSPRKIAIVDGDVLCYHSCPPQRKMIDESTTMKRLDENGKRIYEEMSPDEEMDYLYAAWNNLEHHLKSIGNKLFCDEVLIAIGGVRNFRDDIFSEYKQHRYREGAKPNTTVPKLRARAIAEGLAINALGYEADDLIRIWSEEARRAGHEVIICSVDKDLLCIPGEHYLMHKGKPPEVITVTEIEAARHYHEQLLKGDPTDNIPGIPGIGPVKATKLIAKCETVAEMQEVVVNEYMLFFGEEWLHHLLLNGKLIHIMAHVDDYFTADWPVVKELI